MLVLRKMLCTYQMYNLFRISERKIIAKKLVTERKAKSFFQQ